MATDFRIVVGIATSGRRELLRETLQQLEQQTRPPDLVLVCPAADEDCDATHFDGLRFPWQIVRAPRGLCIQRNAIIDNSKEFDVIVFLDDDFFASTTYLQEVERCFAAEPQVVLCHGNVIADGASGPGFDPGAARALLQANEGHVTKAHLTPTFDAYGCNMAIRLSCVFEQNLRFDPNMPLYGWMEDLEFCGQLRRHGRIVKNWRSVGVHLGTKSGRISGIRYGYSQVANPVYIWKKGGVSLLRAVCLLGHDVMANAVKLFLPEPWVDRRGRARGNWLAILDWLNGRMHPQRILDLP